MQTPSSISLRQLSRRTPPLRGFTLVELLVVIGIIALLMGVLLPTLSRVRMQAAETKCKSNIRQWAQGLQMYLSDSRGTLPRSGGDGDSAGDPVGAWDDPGLWFNALPPRVSSPTYNELQIAHASGGTRLPIEGDNSLFICPSSSIAIKAPAESSAVVSPAGYFNLFGREPGATTSTYRETFICYVLNSKLDDNNNNQDVPVMKVNQLRPASKVAVIVEKRMQPGEAPKSIHRNRTLARMKADWQRFAGRHRQGGMIAFADGHVDWFLEKDVQPVIDPYTGREKGNEFVIWSPLKSIP
jgi:prepilin-type N-terminal cleavage/methylation domain-containing protein/prepilin-type processing-associated H-X9-DG protein